MIHERVGLFIITGIYTLGLAVHDPARRKNVCLVLVVLRWFCSCVEGCGCAVPPLFVVVPDRCCVFLDFRSGATSKCTRLSTLLKDTSRMILADKSESQTTTSIRAANKQSVPAREIKRI